MLTAVVVLCGLPLPAQVMKVIELAEMPPGTTAADVAELVLPFGSVLAIHVDGVDQLGPLEDVVADVFVLGTSVVKNSASSPGHRIDPRVCEEPQGLARTLPSHSRYLVQ